MRPVAATFRLSPFLARPILLSSLVFLGLASTLASYLWFASPHDPVLAGAGDIAGCDNHASEATAKLLDSLHGAIFAVGDIAYDQGTAQQFADCYSPSWGRLKPHTYPATGNIEYKSAAALPYFNYFGAAAGDPKQGYYSYDLGVWHVIVLNSNCDMTHDCGQTSAQAQWLRSDLATHPRTCTLAYWHHPRFSSGPNGNAIAMEWAWQVLYDAGADIVISGHDHDYERFAPQTPAGVQDPVRGLREFVVGTGGRSHSYFGTPKANSEVRNATTFGVLKLTLHPTSYDWQFIPVAGQSFTDSGSAGCH